MGTSRASSSDPFLGLNDTGLSRSTGSTVKRQVKFGRYMITVELTSSGKFAGIVDVLLSKDFLSHDQKIASSGYHDVEKYYRDE